VDSPKYLCENVKWNRPAARSISVLSDEIAGTLPSLYGDRVSGLRLDHDGLSQYAGKVGCHTHRGKSFFTTETQTDPHRGAKAPHFPTQDGTAEAVPFPVVR
jgi:hypothetical protein